MLVTLLEEIALFKLSKALVFFKVPNMQYAESDEEVVLHHLLALNLFALRLLFFRIVVFHVSFVFLYAYSGIHRHYFLAVGNQRVDVELFYLCGKSQQ